MDDWIRKKKENHAYMEPTSCILKKNLLSCTTQHSDKSSDKNPSFIYLNHTVQFLSLTVEDKLLLCYSFI